MPDRTSSASSGRTGWQLLTIPNLRWLWTSQTVSQVGEGLNKVALLWLVYSLTGSSLKMSVIGVLQTLPPLILSPFVGVYVDRFHKKYLMMTVDAVRAVFALGIPLLYGLGWLSLTKLYAVVFIMAVVSTFFTPALSAIVPKIVEKGQLTAANALVTSTAMIGMLVGPAVSGLGIATIGINAVLYINSATFLLTVFCLGQLRLPPRQEPPDSTERGQFWRELKQGLSFIGKQRRTVLALVLSAIVYSLAASAFVFLLPKFSNETLGASPMMLGWLWSAYGGGMVVVTLTLVFMAQWHPSTRLLIVVASMATGALASFGLSRTVHPWIAVALVTVIGASLASFTPIVWGILQELTPDGLRGRVFAVFNTGAMSASMVGLVAFGWAADHLGTRLSLLGMSGVFVLSTTATGFVWYRGHLGSVDRGTRPARPRSLRGPDERSRASVNQASRYD